MKMPFTSVPPRYGVFNSQRTFPWSVMLERCSLTNTNLFLWIHEIKNKNLWNKSFGNPLIKQTVLEVSDIGKRGYAVLKCISTHIRKMRLF
jgi:hypothetical protein